MIKATYTLSHLAGLPTLCTGQADDLKIDTGNQRVWLSRCGLDDGMQFENTVTIEFLIDGKWEQMHQYQAI